LLLLLLSSSRSQKVGVLLRGIFRLAVVLP
jgi:hypothetical protein